VISKPGTSVKFSRGISNVKSHIKTVLNIWIVIPISIVVIMWDRIYTISGRGRVISGRGRVISEVFHSNWSDPYIKRDFQFTVCGNSCLL